MRISIVVLTYKRFDNIEKNIKSILKQTYKNYEVIISDDGSPNFDRSYIESIYKESDDALKFSIITREKNVGTVKNYNQAVSLTTGDVIIPLAQDDVFYDEESLTRIATMFSDQKVNVCLGLRKDSKTGDILPDKFQIDTIKNCEGKKLWFRNACGNMYYGSVLYFRKSFLVSMGLFDEQYVLVEDYSMVMNIIEKGEKIHLIDFPVIVSGSDGISKSASNKSVSPYVQDGIRMCKVNYEHSREILNSRLCRRFLWYRVEIWELLEDKPHSNRFSNTLLDCIILFSKIIQIFTKKEIDDIRFAMLWKFEQISTRLKS